MAILNDQTNLPLDENKITFTEDDIGTRLLDAITSGLYDDNLNCIREYIQNSVDTDETKNITVRLDKSGENLEIRDDGEGMDRVLLRYALKLGYSNKGSGKVGWRGIGIWSGVSVCKKIIIITKRKNKDELKVEIDNDIIHDGIEKNENMLLTLNKAIGPIKSSDVDKHEITEHGTIVRLESILPQHRSLFVDEDIYKYLIKTVPAPFEDDKFKFAKKINSWLKSNGVTLQEVNITFNNKKIYRPPTQDNIFWDAIETEVFKVDGKDIAVGWFLTHNKNEIIDSPNNGIFFKKKGFTLGDENSVTQLYRGTYHRWQYGEIHIISDELRENSARNNFERGPIVGKFIDVIKEFLRELELQNQYQTTKNQSKKASRSKNLLEAGNTREAVKIMRKAEDNIDSKKSFPSRPCFKVVKDQIDSAATVTKSVIKDLEKTVENKNKITEKENDEKFINEILGSLSPKVREKIAKRIRTGGLKDPVIQITDSIEDVLKNKTGLTENEIIKLSTKSYGWDTVTDGGSYSPILVLDPIKDDPHAKPNEKNKHKNRNLRFGAMVYTTQDLFVNLFKHEKGKPSLKWFEGATLAEQKKMGIEMVAVIDLICRMIDASEKYQP